MKHAKEDKTLTQPMQLTSMLFVVVLYVFDYIIHLFGIG